MLQGRIPDLSTCVEPDRVRKEVYTDPQIFDLEMERIHERYWIYCGHESQVPEPGDFVTSRMGTESVLLTRDSEGALHVLLNSCRHRGMKVCRYDEGNTLSFTCPYHGWSYSTDGTLVSVAGELLGVPLEEPSPSPSAPAASAP